MKLVTTSILIMFACIVQAVSSYKTLLHPKKVVTSFHDGKNVVVPTVHTTITTKMLYNIRGGGDGGTGGGFIINRDIAGKIITISCGIQGLDLLLACEKALKDLGFINFSSKIQTVVEAEGMFILASTIIGYCILWKNTSSYTAIGYASAAHILLYIKWIRNGTPLGKIREFTLLFLSIACTYAGLKPTNWVKSYYQFIACFLILCGVTGIISPKTYLKSWGVELLPLSDKQLTYNTIHHSVAALTYGILVGSLATSDNIISVYKAMGYGCFIWVINFLSAVYIRNEPEQIGTYKSPYIIWSIVLTILGTSVLMG